MSRSKQTCPKCGFEFDTQRTDGARQNYHRMLDKWETDKRYLAGALRILAAHGISVGSKELIEAS
jgi:hypothetical protein